LQFKRVILYNWDLFSWSVCHNLSHCLYTMSCGYVFVV